MDQFQVTHVVKPRRKEMCWCASTVPLCQHGQGANRITAKREPCHTSMPPFDYLQRNLDGTKGLNMI